MATVRQVPSGWWQAIVRTKGYPQKSKTFPSKKEADVWGNDVEAQMNRGTFNDLTAAENLSIVEGLKKYLEEITPAKKGAYQEANRIKRMINSDNFSGKTFATFKSFDCAKYRDNMAKDKLSASTINKHLSIISHLYEVALKDWGIHCINPVKQINKPKVSNARERRFRDLEELYLMKALADSSADVFFKFKGDVKKRSNNETIRLVQFAIETAMRKAEPFTLTWADIDFKRNVARLNDTKNGKPREVPLSPRAVEILKDGGDEKVVKLRRGKVFNTTYSALTQSFRRAVERAQRIYARETPEEEQIEGFLVDFTYHDLRHEAISRLAEVFEMQELMKIVGHSDSRMLARYYHPNAENMSKKLAASKIASSWRLKE